MSKLTMKIVQNIIADYRVQAHLELPGAKLNDLELVCAAFTALRDMERATKADPHLAWDELRAQLWGARSGCNDAWQKMSKDIKGINRDEMSRAVQVALVDGRLRVNFAREFYLANRQACHSMNGYWVAAARHLGHTSRPGKRDDGSGYVEFSLEPSSD